MILINLHVYMTCSSQIGSELQVKRVWFCIQTPFYGNWRKPVKLELDLDEIHKNSDKKVSNEIKCEERFGHRPLSL